MSNHDFELNPECYPQRSPLRAAAYAAGGAFAVKKLIVEGLQESTHGKLFTGLAKSSVGVVIALVAAGSAYESMGNMFPGPSTYDPQG